MAAELKNEVQPRAFVAHEQMQDLFLVALVARHPDPRGVLRQFRELVDQLTAATAGDPSVDESFVAAIRRSAIRFDRMVERLLPATGASARVDATAIAAPPAGV
jgi:hypothetical protein